jgi:hypothetical protein
MRTPVWSFFILAIAICACGSGSHLFGSSQGAGGGGGSGGGAGGDEPARAERMDLLLVIDNSRSMTDKQQVLGLAIGSLIRSLVNPLCLDELGRPLAQQPLTPDDECPAKSARPFEPIVDLHIGVITTSLGGHGADACSSGALGENDHGWLLTRAPTGGQVPTYQELGFLAWDPKKQFDPPGLLDADVLTSQLESLLLGAGQSGCGFEATFESWYRFLVDPDPYQSIEVQGGQALLVGTDEKVLAQRADFLRPDSLLAIVSLSDENDCSIRDGGAYFAAGQILVSGGGELYHLPRPRAACAVDPNDPCCRSCGQPPGPGCSDAADQCDGALTDLEDNVNLRCFDQKRRFGLDFLYPIDRYVEGLSSPQIADRNGDVVQNPIFSDLQSSGAIGKERDPRLVVLASLVGVPWQDIARRTNGKPDLLTGNDAAGRPVGGFKTAAELGQDDTWSLILGVPSQYHTNLSSLPMDHLMIESVEPRSGVHPITGDPIAPPGAAPDANPINGHEYTIPLRDDLQYACIFPLLVPRDCSNPNEVSCDCENPANDSPLCQNEQGTFTTTQYRAKAYPGLRHLQLAKALGEQAVVGSICPAQLVYPNATDFAYVPLVRTLVESITPRLSH